MYRPPSSSHIRRRACGLPCPASGRRSRLSVVLHACFLTGAASAPETRPLLAVSCAYPSRVQRRPTGEAVIPRPIVRGPMAVVLPWSCFPVPPPGRFGLATADYVDRPQVAMGSRHRPGTAPGPASDRPTPRRRSNSDHAGESSYSGKIDYQFLTLQTSSRI